MATTVDPQALLVQLLDPSNRADPYPAYEQIRARGPLILPDAHLVVFSSFTDCDDALRHPSSASDRMKSTMAQRMVAEGGEERPLGPPGFLFLDPPDHTRLRKLVSKAFVPKVVKALEPDITEMVYGFLDLIEERGTFDVIDDLAHPLPVAVICRLLGVPLEDEPKFSHASALLAQALDPFSTFTGDLPDNFDERMAAAVWLRDYLHDLVDQRRAAPREDLISGLIAAEEGGDQLTEEEIVATCNLLLVAGHETTVNLVANAILAMLRQPAQWTALAADPDRESIRHLGFGKGPHFCLGAPLARLEASVALSAVTARFPNAHMVGDPVYKPNVTLRGLATLAVAV